MITGKSKKQARAKSTTSSSSYSFMASSSSSSAAPPPPPSVAKKGFLRRIFPLILTANFAVGAYVLAKTWKKEPAEKDKEATKKVRSSPVLSTEIAVSEKTVSTESLPAPVEARSPIPEHEQRELFKWILEEKRKVKPIDSSEKKKINEEKALLKQLIRAESIPSL